MVFVADRRGDSIGETAFANDLPGEGRPHAVGTSRMNDSKAILRLVAIHNSFAAHTYFPTTRPIFPGVVAIPALPSMPGASA
jgi:hypothetical protein